MLLAQLTRHSHGLDTFLCATQVFNGDNLARSTCFRLGKIDADASHVEKSASDELEVERCAVVLVVVLGVLYTLFTKGDGDSIHTKDVRNVVTFLHSSTVISLISRHISFSF